MAKKKSKSAATNGKKKALTFRLPPKTHRKLHRIRNHYQSQRADDADVSLNQTIEQLIEEKEV